MKRGKPLAVCPAFFVSDAQLVHARLHFGDAAHVFAHVVGELDALAPLLCGGHLALRQLHHYVCRFVAGVVGEVGSHSERAFYLTFAIVEYAQALLEIECVAEYDCLAHGVDAEFLVARYKQVDESYLVAGVAAHAVEQLRLLAAEVR